METLLIDDQLRMLLNEFNSYIAESLRIIRNHNHLQKYKDYILKAQQESEVDLRSHASSPDICSPKTRTAE